MAIQAGTQTAIAFQAGKPAFRPNGAQHVSLGQVNPRMRMNAAPGHTNISIHCPEGATQFFRWLAPINPTHTVRQFRFHVADTGDAVRPETSFFGGAPVGFQCSV